MVVHKFSHAKKLLLIVVLTFTSSTAISSEIKTLEDLDLLQSQTTYFKALAAKNKAEKESGGGDVLSYQSSPTQSVGEGGIAANQPINSLPVVAGVMGNSKGLIARLQYRDGSVSTNKVGDIISGNLKVTKITVNQVEVQSISGGGRMILKEGAN